MMNARTMKISLAVGSTLVFGASGSSLAQSSDSASARPMISVAPTLGAMVRPELGYLIGGTLELRSSIEPSVALDYLYLGDVSGALVHFEVARRSGGVVGGVGFASFSGEHLGFAVGRIGYETKVGFGLDLRVFHGTEDTFWTFVVHPFSLRF